MKSVLVGLIVFATAFSCTEMAWGDISARATVTINGQNSQGPGPGFVFFSENEVDFDQFTANTGEVEISGGTDIGVATARAGAFGSHVNGKRFVGIGVAGTANISRPDHHPGATGSVQASGEAVVDFTDELLFNFVPTSPDQVRLGGFLYLAGNLNSATIENGPDINTFASSTVSISGTGLTPVEAGGNTLGLPSLNQTIGQVILFSFDVSSGVPKPISFRMRVVGVANVTGPQFNVGPAASASAGFTASFLQSLSWGGITSVTNLRTGEPITEWSVTSESGFDYTQVFPPIPEPSSIVLLSLGLCASLGRARRRGRRA